MTTRFIHFGNHVVNLELIEDFKFGTIEVNPQYSILKPLFYVLVELKAKKYCYVSMDQVDIIRCLAVLSQPSEQCIPPGFGGIYNDKYLPNMQKIIQIKQEITEIVLKYFNYMDNCSTIIVVDQANVIEYLEETHTPSTAEQIQKYNEYWSYINGVNNSHLDREYLAFELKLCQQEQGIKQYMKTRRLEQTTKPKEDCIDCHSISSRCNSCHPGTSSECGELLPSLDNQEVQEDVRTVLLENQQTISPQNSPDQTISPYFIESKNGIQEIISPIQDQNKKVRDWQTSEELRRLVMSLPDSPRHTQQIPTPKSQETPRSEPNTPDESNVESSVAQINRQTKNDNHHC